MSHALWSYFGNNCRAQCGCRVCIHGLLWFKLKKLFKPSLVLVVSVAFIKMSFIIACECFHPGLQIHFRVQISCTIPYSVGLKWSHCKVFLALRLIVALCLLGGWISSAVAIAIFIGNCIEAFSRNSIQCVIAMWTKLIGICFGASVLKIKKHSKTNNIALTKHNHTYMVNSSHSHMSHTSCGSRIV